MKRAEHAHAWKDALEDLVVLLLGLGQQVLRQFSHLCFSAQERRETRRRLLLIAEFKLREIRSHTPVLKRYSLHADILTLTTLLHLIRTRARHGRLNGFLRN